jgi:hypothetical protein
VTLPEAYSVRQAWSKFSRMDEGQWIGDENATGEPATRLNTPLTIGMMQVAAAEDDYSGMAFTAASSAAIDRAETETTQGPLE